MTATGRGPSALARPARSIQWILRQQLTWIGVVACIGLAATYSIQDPYSLSVLALVFLWALAGQSWNLCYGYSGQLSFGHAIFVGVGGYTLVLLLTHFHMSPWFSLPLGMLAAGILAIGVGLVASGLAGAYFAIATLVLPLIAIVILDYLGLTEIDLPLTGAQGPGYMVFTSQRSYALIGLIAMLLGLIVMWSIDRSRVALVLKTLRGSDVVANSVGVNVRRWKILALAVSGAMAALFGALWVEASLLTVSSADLLGSNVIIQMISVSLIGGIGSKWGPLIGASILIPITEYANAHYGGALPGINLLVNGGLIVIVILLTNDGIVGGVTRLSGSMGRRWFPGAGSRDATSRGAHRELGDLVVPVAEHRSPRQDAVTSQEWALGTRPGRGGPPVLELQGISKSFSGVEALDNVSLSISGGEIVGIIGPNGAGKTSLLNVITGLYAPDKGLIHLCGKDITKTHAHARTHMGMARTFQTAQLLDGLSILDNIAASALVHTRSASAARRVATMALDLVGLDGPERHPPALNTLEARLVELARAVACEPQIILVDEAMSGLNRDEHVVLIELLRKIRRRGVAIALIEHAVASLVEVSDSLLVLDQGRVLATGSSEEVLSDATVIEAYLGTKWSRKAGRE